jgi:S1-C subfamily serine protease
MKAFFGGSFAALLFKAFCGGACAVFCFALPAWADGRDRISDSVVKVYATRREPDFLRPWSKDAPRETAGTGVIIGGKRILTNAHVVSYASQVFVQANQSTDRVSAKVKAIALDVDMAIVEVEDASFFDARPPLTLADGIPTLKQSVSVYGYPVGGEQLSITQGVVSRIEYTPLYYHVSGLRIQIDAALNPGNSGGPAVSDGKMIGLVFSKFSAGENIGYLLAVEEIQMFLKAIERGPYRGKPQFWDYWSTTENEALRGKLGLGKEGGVIVCQAASDAPDYPLKRGDVITRIGQEPLDSRGDVKVRDDLRLDCEYLIPKLAKDGRVRLSIVRDRKTSEIEVPVRSDGNLVMPPLMGKYPRYFVYGPMVFMAASQDLAARLAGSSAGALTVSQSPLLPRFLDHPAFEGEEIVTLGAALLPHKTSKGYTPPPFSVVTKVDGRAVRNLVHLVELLRDAKGEFLTIDLAGPTCPLVFRREEALRATEEILSDEGIRKQYSDDLEGVWRR